MLVASALALRNNGEPVDQAVQQCLRREEVEASGGQLDRQWKAVQTSHDLCYCGGVARVREKPGSTARARCTKRATASPAMRALRSMHSSAFRDFQRRDREYLFAG